MAGKNKFGMIFIAAIFAFSVPAAAETGADIKKAWELFNGAQNAESLAICEKLLAQYPDDQGKTPEALLLMSLNYDHLAYKSKKKDDQLKAKAAVEKIIDNYPASGQAAEAYFYLGEIYSGNIPVIIETDCGKALPMYVKAVERTDKKWVKDESYKGIDRCKVKPMSDIAQNLVDMSEYELALPIYQKIAEKYPGSEAAQYAQMMLGICYDGLGNSGKALEAYETAIKKYKPYKGDSLFYYYGEVLQKAGRYAEAEENYKKVINDPASHAWAVKSAQEGLEQIKRDSAVKPKTK